MTKFVKILLLAFSLCILAGCEHDPKDSPEPERFVTINFSTETQSISMLKSAASSEENAITKIILFGVDDQDNIIERYATRVNPSLTGQLTISMKVKTLYAIANPSPDMEAASPSFVSDLMNMVVDFTNLPSSPFLMSGSGTVDNGSVNIQLIRAVAKIEFTSKNGFTIDAVTVMNTPNKGYVFEPAIFSVPYSATLVNHSNIEVSGSYTVLYIAESASENPPQFVVTGQFEGKTANYTFALKSGKQNIDIERNSHYQVGIIPITESECEITISNLPEWSDVTTDTLVVSIRNPYKDGIKILTIGNSYSLNAMTYMYDLLKQLGVDEDNQGNILLVNAYRGGESLQGHVLNIQNSIAYQWQSFHSNGVMSVPGDFVLQKFIEYTEWDVIVLQQASWISGDPVTYNSDLDYLIDYIAQHAINLDFKFGWHMTWAYSADYVYGFPFYDRNQLVMYQAICNTVETKIETNAAFDFIIPAGTAIQNARSHFGHDNFNFDGTHLDNLGCYIVAAMWVKTITGYDIAKLTVPYTAASNINTPHHCPPYTINNNDFVKIIQSVNTAAANPFQSP